MSASKPTVRIVERDGDVVEILAIGSTTVTCICELNIVGSRLILDCLHIDGAGPGISGISELREMARELGVSMVSKKS